MLKFVRGGACFVKIPMVVCFVWAQLQLLGGVKTFYYLIINHLRAGPIVPPA